MAAAVQNEETIQNYLFFWFILACMLILFRVQIVINTKEPMQGSHRDWKIGNIFQSGKSQGILHKILEKYGKLLN